MVSPVLTLLVAGSLHAHAPGDGSAELARIAFEITQLVPMLTAPDPAAASPPTVRDLEYHFDDLRAVPAPSTPVRVVYDWRSPVYRDFP